jgi:hypothetical protein
MAVSRKGCSTSKISNEGWALEKQIRGWRGLEHFSGLMTGRFTQA